MYMSGEYDTALVQVFMRAGSKQNDIGVMLALSTENNDLPHFCYCLRKLITLNPEKEDKEWERVSFSDTEHHKETNVDSVYFDDSFDQIHISLDNGSIYISKKTAKRLINIILKTRHAMETAGHY